MWDLKRQIVTVGKDSYNSISDKRFEIIFNYGFELIPFFGFLESKKRVSCKKEYLCKAVK
ncbi:hypothetical protein DB891_14725 [Flavobacterium laiguense]|uniref:Uncharacterized protein n=1 Tax=Flavobacterium laiguense TaxID=2169409 RepID=A0A2U1JQI3_9FLAO|nr:hypothetical protein DB891_14725 [Flavobacterium laiguense]